MHRALPCALVISVQICCLTAQSPPDSELIARLRLDQAWFAQWDHGVSLAEKERTTGRDVTADLIVMETPAQCGRCPEPNATDDPDVKRATDASDLVATGVVTRNLSALTQNQAFVFTNSEFAIDEVWKPQKGPDGRPVVAAGEEITLTEPGGTVKEDGHLIRASLSNRISLLVGHRYLMYLKYLPESRSYEPSSLDGFDITETAVQSLRTTIIPPAHDLMRDRTLFLQAMRASTNRAMVEKTR